MAVEVNLGKVRLTEEEMRALVENHTGGVRLGKDEEGNYGYYKYDEEAGADTLVPFKAGGAGSVKLRQYGAATQTGTSFASAGARILLHIQNPEKVKRIVANGSISAGNTSSTEGVKNIQLVLGGTQNTGGSKRVTLASVQTYNKNISTASTALENEEIDLSAFDLSKTIYFECITASNVRITVDMEYEVFF